MNIDTIMTHIAALLAGVGVAYAYLVHLVGYIHPMIADLQQQVARLENRPVAPTVPVQLPPEQASPTQAPAGAPKAA